MKRLLTGNEATALGALRAGVRVAAGYPGTPSSEILETLSAAITDAGYYGDGKGSDIEREKVYAEWSVNEKVALEIAAGAAIAGVRAIATMKQVGLNVASDPLMSLNMIGVKAGMVVIVADDPGPLSSQTEQDTRQFAIFARVAAFDPSSPAECYTMIADALDWSEKIGRPVIFHLTTRVCHSREPVRLLPALPSSPPSFDGGGGRWAIMPGLAYANHVLVEKELTRLSEEFSAYPGNYLDIQTNRQSDDGKIKGHDSRRGIATGGVGYLYAMEAITRLGISDCNILKVATVPFPTKLGEEFLHNCDEVLVIEELYPVIEDALYHLKGSAGFTTTIHGRRDGSVPVAGEIAGKAFNAVARYLRADTGAYTHKAPDVPKRPPSLCPGCPHKYSFEAVKKAAGVLAGKKDIQVVYSGDIGCYTLGASPPLNMGDTCLCMGAGITMAQGINRALTWGRARPNNSRSDSLNIAFIGDSTFFHSGITGLINAVYNGYDIVVCVLDNRTTAMTGGQFHPGVGTTLMNGPSPRMDIRKICEAVGVTDIVTVNAFDRQAADLLMPVLDSTGVRVVIFEGKCVMDKRGGK
jgi:indolepyruvate ferredoxin oxidoreductase alpha subunit